MDEAINEVIQLKEAGTPLSDEVHKTASAAARRLFNEWGKLGLVGSCTDALMKGNNSCALLRLPSNVHLLLTDSVCKSSWVIPFR